MLHLLIQEITHGDIFEAFYNFKKFWNVFGGFREFFVLFESFLKVFNEF